MTEISGEELEKRLREKWFGSLAAQHGKPVLSEHDRKVAAKLLGDKNAQRLAHSDRPFRYRAPVITAEYYHAPDGEFHCGGWCLDMIEDGVRRKVIQRGSWQSVSLKIRELDQKGIPLRRFETERMAVEAQRHKTSANSRKEGRRSEIMNRLKEFRL